MRRTRLVVALAIAVVAVVVLVAAPVLARGGGPGPTPATGQGRAAGPDWATGMGAGLGTGAGLYAAFAARYDAPVFDRIAAAESSHLTAVRSLLERYQVADPTAGKAPGKFASATVQASYDRLLKQGKDEPAPASATGRAAVIGCGPVSTATSSSRPSRTFA